MNLWIYNTLTIWDMKGKSEADKEAVKKISKYVSKEIVRQIKEKMKELRYEKGMYRLSLC